MSKRDGSEPYLDPMHSIGYLSRINFRAFSRALEKLTIRHGVSAGQWRFLRVLWDQDGITQRELADRTGTTEATTVRSVNGLLESGLIKRERVADDRRKMRVTLTARGRRLRNTLLPMVIEVNERALKGIPKRDIETTRRVLIAAFENLTADRQERR
ncbi:MAG: MarR family transcriptional regulator [Pseudomonadales bacterium]|jgi:DNA-binding MarR family transcriptional regulator